MKINKTIVKIGIFLIAIGVLIGICVFSLTRPKVTYVAPINGIRFEVKQGDSLSTISHNLKSMALIKSPLAFKWYVILRGWPFSLKAGFYYLDPNWKASQIAYIIHYGLTDKNRVLVIPEGMTLAELNTELKELSLLGPNENLMNFHVADFNDKLANKIFSGADPGNTLEGYFFPDTYRISPGTMIGNIILTFLQNFKHKIPVSYIQSASLNGHDFYSILIMASILEKEVPDQQERFIVSGILWKRLKADMLLQVDAAVCYAKNKAYDGCHNLSSKDLKIDSPYNTYLYKGLPPTPIANPGSESIQAALYPKDSPYWYYISDPKTKDTIFAKTLEEHEANIKKYLR